MMQNTYVSTAVSRLTQAIAVVALLGSSPLRAQEADGRLIDLGRGVERQQIVAEEGSRVSLSGPGRNVVELRAMRDVARARVVLKAPDGAWDLSARAAVNFRLHNPGDTPLVVYANASNPGATHLQDNSRSGTILMPGDRKDLRVRLVRRPEDPGYAQFQPFFMYFANINVRDNTVDPANIEQLSVWIDFANEGQRVQIERVWATGDGESGEPAFFPFADEFGQYVHSDWPGKIYEEADLSARIEEERLEMADWPGPSSWNEYGGWGDGPQLEATGYFRVEKVQGKWWLVDPAGRLFWSNGATGVGYGGDVTPVSDREHWFAALPERDGPFANYYHRRRGATYRYYQNRSWDGIDIGGINLERKYGPNYGGIVANLSHERVRSWGLNTMANWSAPEVYLLKRTPYTVAIHYGGPWMHYRTPDVYHPDWQPALRTRLERERETTAGDPWNIGYFVDNELWWGWRPRAAAVGLTALGATPETHSKRVFVSMLQEKYVTIAALNEAWQAGYESWQQMIETREGPNADVARVVEDCGDFGMKFAERYFSIVRDEVKRIAPENMYLGVRFHGHIDAAVVELCGKYADVVSYNVYDNPPIGRLNQYLRLDLPIICGEWGTRSNPLQTPFRGDELTIDPQRRSQEVARYLEAGLRHPLLVGAHFFQYRDQPLTGRPDGEAVLRGFVNITDTPHFDIIQTSRRVGYRMYERRFGAE
jgi:hypothetical protein